MEIRREDIRVLILAGGKATRLMPFTSKLPKSLLPIGGQPILEILIRQLAQHGFRNITIAVGHLAGLIEAYFQDGRDFGVQIGYAREEEPLGTAGPIARLPYSPLPLLVVNGDLVTGLDFGGMLSFHISNSASATIAVHRHVQTDPVAFGVVDLLATGAVASIREKPHLDYLANMGVYVLSPIARTLVPPRRIDITEVIQNLISYCDKVVAYVSEDYWMDIGGPGDYEKANQDRKP